MSELMDRATAVSALRHLHPPTPSVSVMTEGEARCSLLQAFWFQQPITLVRGLTAAVKLDLGLFATPKLVEVDGEAVVEVTEQSPSPDEVWELPCAKSSTSLQQYAGYQASASNQMARDVANSNDDGANIRWDGNITGYNHGRRLEGRQVRGAKVVLSPEGKWDVQRAELTKLPEFSRIDSPKNMLATVPGLNAVQVHLKVAGCRIPARQHEYCTVNINVGPGDCRWFIVAEAHWSTIHDLCKEKNVDFLGGSWWPVLKDLETQNVPVFELVQRPGDLVWVDSGCVRWVQADGPTNDIAWSVGPTTARHYELLLDRYRLHKRLSVKTTVPVVGLSWSLARRNTVGDPKLFGFIQVILIQSLSQCKLILEFVSSKGLRVQPYDRWEKEPFHCCNGCKVEVFNLLLVSKQEMGPAVFCLACAKMLGLQGFVCVLEQPLQELSIVLDQFQLRAKVDAFGRCPELDALFATQNLPAGFTQGVFCYPTAEDFAEAAAEPQRFKGVDGPIQSQQAMDVVNNLPVRSDVVIDLTSDEEMEPILGFEEQTVDRQALDMNGRLVEAAADPQRFNGFDGPTQSQQAMVVVNNLPVRSAGVIAPRPIGNLISEEEIEPFLGFEEQTMDRQALDMTSRLVEEWNEMEPFLGFEEQTVDRQALDVNRRLVQVAAEPPSLRGFCQKASPVTQHSLDPNSEEGTEPFRSLRRQPEAKRRCLFCSD